MQNPFKQPLHSRKIAVLSLARRRSYKSHKAKLLRDDIVSTSIHVLLVMKHENTENEKAAQDPTFV